MFSTVPKTWTLKHWELINVKEQKKITRKYPLQMLTGIGKEEVTENENFYRH